MRIFVQYNDDRLTIDVGEHETVGEVKETVRDACSIGPDEGPAGVEGQDKKILTLNFMGAELDNAWFFTDLGISAGSTIKAQLKEELKPVLYIKVAFNAEKFPVLEKLNVQMLKGAEVRTIVTRKTGLPVGTFRMLTRDGVEVYDCHTMDDYGVTTGDWIRVETWDGWNEFLNVCIMGFSSHVMANLSSDEVTARYQMKVAMFIASHYGHVDLAVHLLRLGIRADEPIGDHPYRQWCRGETPHIDSFKTPIHQCAEMGQLGVLRSFVHYNMCNVLAKDGNGLTPLNITLRKKQKACAGFLLTKQWSKVNYTKRCAIPLSIFVKMKRWSDRAKDKTLVVHGQWKSSVKNPKRHVPNGALVGYGVQLDGFTESKMTCKATSLVRMEEEREQKRKRRMLSVTEDMLREESQGLEPEVYFKSLGMIQTLKLPKLNMSKLGKMLTKAAQATKEREDKEDKESDAKSGGHSSGASPENARKFFTKTANSVNQDNLKLPPITERLSSMTSQKSASHQNLTTAAGDEEDFDVKKGDKSVYIQTGGGKAVRPKARSIATPTPTRLHAPPITTKSSNSPAAADEKSLQNKEADLKKSRKERSIRSAIMLAKSRTGDSSIPLPLDNREKVPRPFVGYVAERLTRQTLDEYEKHRGLKSRDYAIKCLAVANSFKERPWLIQVQQAMTIAARGVRKTVSRLPHMFRQSDDLDSSSPGNSINMSSTTSEEERDHKSVITI